MSYIKSLDSINNYQDWLNCNSVIDNQLRSPIYNNYLPTTQFSNSILVSQLRSSKNTKNKFIIRNNHNDSPEIKHIRNQYYFTYSKSLKTVILNIVLNNGYQILQLSFSTLYCDNKGNIKASNNNPTLSILDKKYLVDVDIAVNRSYDFIDDISSTISILDLMSKRQLKRYKIARAKKRM